MSHCCGEEEKSAKKREMIPRPQIKQSQKYPLKVMLWQKYQALSFFASWLVQKMVNREGTQSSIENKLICIKVEGHMQNTEIYKQSS